MNNSESVTKWFYEEPIDFESKKYRLLDSISKAQQMIEDGEIHDAMSYVEDYLGCFYKFKTEKELVALDNRDIIGIDPILMRLVFDSKSKDNSREIEILSDIAELGILEFEALHSLFRIKWRDIDDALKISYIPDKPVFLKNGYAFLSNSEEKWTRIYTFEDPRDCDEWKDFSFNFVEEHGYDQSKILDFVSTLKQTGSEAVILNCTINKGFDSREAIDFVLTCKIYYRLLKDYMF